MRKRCGWVGEAVWVGRGRCAYSVRYLFGRVFEFVRLAACRPGDGDAPGVAHHAAVTGDEAIGVKASFRNVTLLSMLEMEPTFARGGSKLRDAPFSAPRVAKATNM